MNGQRSSTRALLQYPDRGNESQMHLHGKVLVWPRCVWLLLTAAMLACLPPSYQMLQRVCDSPSNSSLFMTKAPPTKVLAMHMLGLELSDFVIISLCIQVVVTLVLLTMGMLTFWRRSGTPQGLITSTILNVPGSTGMFFRLGGHSIECYMTRLARSLPANLSRRIIVYVL